MKYEVMLKMQNDLNTAIDANWKLKENDYQLAITVELGELIDHVGYKWWKKQETNLFQCKLEVVDVFHFYLCDTLMLGIESSGIKRFEGEIIKPNIDKENKNQVIKKLINKSSSNSFSHNEMFELMNMFMTYEELYDMYISKNVLNNFRNKNGYKEGTYNKLWDGEEDNSFLERVITESSIDKSAINYPEVMFDTLQRRYDFLFGKNEQ